MRYQCKKCNTEYEIEQSGQYQCQCGETFTIDTTQVTTQVTTQEAQCPFCKSAIPEDARKCKHCGEWIKGKPKSKLVYCLLSLFLPTGIIGAAEFYIGRSLLGTVVFVVNIIIAPVLFFLLPNIGVMIILLVLIFDLIVMNTGYKKISKSILSSNS